MNGMVYFQCQQAVWREDIALEHPGVRFWMHEMDNRFKENTDNLAQYRTTLREYTRRKLSYQEDAVKAYTGILEAQRVMLRWDPGPHICGMHRNLMHWLLLWRSAPKTRRYEALPSWSWAGWIGEAKVPYPFCQTFKGFGDWICDHVCAEFHYHKSLEVFGLPFVKDALQICAPVAEFRVDSDSIYEPGFVNALWTLRDARGHICGYAQLHDDEDGPRFVNRIWGGRVKVLVLSDMVPGQGQFPTTKHRIEYDAEIEHMQSSTGSALQKSVRHFRNLFCTSAVSSARQEPIQRWQIPLFTGYEGKTQPEVSEEPFECYNVMLVLLRYIFAEGGNRYFLYERFGVGVLHNKALQWAFASAPKKGTILLV
jgi:hypothetical protein